jgi:hypothetical protein
VPTRCVPAHGPPRDDGHYDPNRSRQRNETSVFRADLLVALARRDEGIVPSRNESVCRTLDARRPRPERSDHAGGTAGLRGRGCG